MSRDDGFAVMDVSTSWLSDDKFTRLAREHPRQLLWCVSGYAATKAASWRHGKRMRITDSLPAWLAFNAEGIGALVSVKLLDRTGRIPAKTWRDWFGPAQKRRQLSLDRWARANEKRRQESTSEHDLPRGNSAATEATVRPSVRPTREDIQGLRVLTGREAIGAVDPR